MDRRAWKATVHRITNNLTWLKRLSTHTNALNVINNTGISKHVILYFFFSFTFQDLFCNMCLLICYGGGLVVKSCPTLATPWTIAHQAPLSMGFSRQEYWDGLPFPSPGDLPNPGLLHSDRFFTDWAMREVYNYFQILGAMSLFSKQIITHCFWKCIVSNSVLAFIRLYPLFVDVLLFPSRMCVPFMLGAFLIQTCTLCSLCNPRYSVNFYE